MASLPGQPPDQVAGPMAAGTQRFRPPVFIKMEALVREMQDAETGVPVRSQKMFLTSIPSAFMGYDLIEWLMEHYNIEDSLEAIHIANLLCQRGYFFPVGEAKSLSVKDDSSLYRFQTPHFWPSKDHYPDDNDYAVYLTKRHLRNKQKHALEDWEQDEISRLKQTLCGKWDIITIQAEEQVKQSKDFKKGDKIVTDSQERAYWRVYRPPPGQCSVLDVIPIQQKRPASRKHITFTSLRALKKYVVYLRESMNHSRVKVSCASESVIHRWELYCDHDPFFSCPHAPNPWLQEDTLFWTLNKGIVEVPTERRVRRWAINLEETLSDPTGAREFESYLHKEYSHENIRFFWTVREHRYGSGAGVEERVKQIYSEFLVTGAPCEVNIDSATMDATLEAMKQPSRHTFNLAQDHVYALLKKDCYPRFLRSEHYKNIAQNSIPPQSKRRFFSFGVQTRKKHSTVAANMGHITGPVGSSTTMGPCLPVIDEKPQVKGKEERAGSGEKTKLSLASAAGVFCPWEGKTVKRAPGDDDTEELPVTTTLPKKLEPRSALTVDDNYSSLRLSPKKERKPCEDIPVSPKKERKISNASLSSMSATTKVITATEDEKKAEENQIPEEKPAIEETAEESATSSPKKQDQGVSLEAKSSEAECTDNSEESSELQKTECTQGTTRKTSSSSFLEHSSSALDINLPLQEEPCMETGEPSELQGEVEGPPSGPDLQEKRPSEVSITLGKAEELPNSPLHSPRQLDLPDPPPLKTETKNVTFSEDLSVNIITPQEPLCLGNTVSRQEPICLGNIITTQESIGLGSVTNPQEALCLGSEEPLCLGNIIQPQEPLCLGSIINPQESMCLDYPFLSESIEKRRDSKPKSRERSREGRRSRRKQRSSSPTIRTEVIAVAHTSGDTVKAMVGVSVDDERISPVHCLVAEQHQDPTKPIQTPEICPWEDEDNCKLETHSPFVKMYATLGYL